MKEKKQSGKTRRSYLSGEFCNITGLKPDTLRFYVDKGVLSPTVNPENQYKMYSSRDVVDMAFVRSRRAMGVPIFNINEVLTKVSTQQQLEWYADYERQLEQELEEVQMKLNRCRKAQRDLHNLKNYLGKIADKSKDEGPHVYQLLLVGPNVLGGEERYSLAEEWREKESHVLSMIHIPQKELEDPSCQFFSVTYGLALPAGMLKGDTSVIRNPAYLYPSQDNVGMMIRVEDPFVVKRSDLQPLLDYIEEKNYRVIDDMTSWLFARTVEDGKDYYYFAMRVSVDKSGVGL